MYLHGDLDTAISYILAGFDAFAVMISVLGRKSFDPIQGPIEIDDAVFSFRRTNAKAWGKKYFTQPNFSNVTQFSTSLVWYGAPYFIATTRLGMVNLNIECAMKLC